MYCVALKTVYNFNVNKFSQLEVTKLNEEVDKHERVAKQTKNDIIKLEAENRILTDENKSLRRNIQLVNVELGSRYVSSFFFHKYVINLELAMLLCYILFLKSPDHSNYSNPFATIMKTLFHLIWRYWCVLQAEKEI